jgi:hypothetical protein
MVTCSLSMRARARARGRYAGELLVWGQSRCTGRCSGRCRLMWHDHEADSYLTDRDPVPGIGARREAGSSQQPSDLGHPREIAGVPSECGQCVDQHATGNSRQE